ncbi:MAG: hypothetical protein M1160_02815 [Candidatus Marsarchaeota archaeon]|jgi:translation initiation factor 2 beta subunit (eIF-2beta)/eIF-5|nr:hypothetical protein [Candidatus Marsarchaeota archaeon]MCL5111785.1 hypothetical protein [Candidatus Marsarchaeota archaeon]
MKYVIRINKRVRYLRTYTILKRVGEHENLLTKVFERIFNRKKKGSEFPT